MIKACAFQPSKGVRSPQNVHSPRTSSHQPLSTTMTPAAISCKTLTELHHSDISLICLWSATLAAPVPLSMLFSAPALLRSSQTSLIKLPRCLRSHYSTLSSSHKDQVTIPCRSNGHITLRQVVVANPSIRISLNAFLQQKVLLACVTLPSDSICAEKFISPSSCFGSCTRHHLVSSSWSSFTYHTAYY